MCVRACVCVCVCVRVCACACAWGGGTRTTGLSGARRPGPGRRRLSDCQLSLRSDNRELQGKSWLQTKSQRPSSAPKRLPAIRTARPPPVGLSPGRATGCDQLGCRQRACQCQRLIRRRVVTLSADWSHWPPYQQRQNSQKSNSPCPLGRPAGPAGCSRARGPTRRRLGCNQFRVPRAEFNLKVDSELDSKSRRYHGDSQDRDHSGVVAGGRNQRRGDRDQRDRNRRARDRGRVLRSPAPLLLLL